MYAIFLLTVPDPDSIAVIFNPNTSTPYVGTFSTLTCTIILPEVLDVPSVGQILWFPSTVYSDGNIQITDVTQFLDTALFQSTLTFSPVLSQHIGQYTCQGKFDFELTEQFPYLQENTGTGLNTTVEITPQGMPL